MRGRISTVTVYAAVLLQLKWSASGNESPHPFSTLSEDFGMNCPRLPTLLQAGSSLLEMLVEEPKETEETSRTEAADDSAVGLEEHRAKQFEEMPCESVASSATAPEPCANDIRGSHKDHAGRGALKQRMVPNVSEEKRTYKFEEKSVETFENNQKTRNLFSGLKGAMNIRMQSEQRLLIVFASYIPDDHNCLLLDRATKSALKFHSVDGMVVVVDDGSPENLQACMQDQFQSVTVLQNKLGYEPGAWKAVQQLIEDPDSSVSQWKPTHVVMLQHSIFFVRGISAQSMPCPVMSMSMYSYCLNIPRTECLYFDLSWTESVVTCMNIHCGGNCQQDGPVTTEPLLDWTVTPHSAILFPISDWRKLAELGLWRCMGDERMDKVKSLNFERLTGILAAKLGYNAERCHVLENEYLHKEHGATA